jgi:hypothetical protein
MTQARDERYREAPGLCVTGRAGVVLCRYGVVGTLI